MISRCALACIALAGLTGQAAAQAVGPATSGEAAVVRTRGKPARAALGVLPPARPAELADATGSGSEPSRPAALTAPSEPPVNLRSGFAEPGSAPGLAVRPPARPTFRADARQPATLVLPEPEPPPPPPSLFAALFGPRPAAATAEPGAEAAPAGRGRIDQLIAHHARLNSVPEALVHRVVVRESRYNPRAIGRGGAMGLMQIKTATARGVGYTGGPAGLLDAETNLTYAVRYLAGAYRTAGGNHDRAVGYYARGYYYAAKRQGFGLRAPGRGPEEPAPAGTPFLPPPAPVLATTQQDWATR